MSWPNYYCVERTLDIHLPGGREVRVWFNAGSSMCQPVVQATLARGMRQDKSMRTCPQERIVDWMAAFEGVNAVQVRDDVEGFHVGTVAYFVSFGSTPWAWLKRIWYRFRTRAARRAMEAAVEQHLEVGTDASHSDTHTVETQS